MSDAGPDEMESRVLVLAPTARDAAASCKLLADAGVQCFVCATIADVCREVGRGAGAALVTAEAIIGDTLGLLAGQLRTQPPWSDLPLIVLTPPGDDSSRMLRALEAVGSMTLMKRPVQVSTLVSAVRSALRDRERQYAVRAFMDERERYQVTLSSIGDAVIATDNDGRVTFLNHVAEELTRWDEASARGRPLEEVFRIVNETTREQVPNPAKRALEEGVIVGLANHTVLIARDGTESPLDDSAAPIRGRAGEIIGAVLVFRDISERKAADEARERLTETLGLALDAGDLGTWEWDAATDAMTLSARAREIYGVEAGQSHRREHLRSLIHPDNPDRARQAAVLAATDRTDYGIEYPLGNGRWVAAHGRGVYSPDGRLNRMIGMVQDVSARKRAEQQLRTSEDRHGFLVTLADALRPLSDPTAVQVVASRVLGKRLGANRVVYFEIRGDEFVVARDFTDMARPIAGSYPIASFGPALLANYRNGNTVIEDNVEAHPTLTPEEKNEFVALQIRAYVGVPLVKGGELVAGLAVHSSKPRAWTPAEVVLVEDTAERTWAAVERVRAEAGLRASEEGRRLALESAELGTWHVNPVTRATTTDARFRAIFGTTEEWTDYLQMFAVIYPDDLPAVEAAVAAAIRPDDPTPYAIEYRIVRPDGSLRWVFAKGRTNTEEGPAGRRVVSFDGTVMDITAHKQASAERDRLIGQLRDADRKKDDFLALLAHELRNPLAPIRNGLQIIRLSRDPASLDRSQQMMDRQLTHMVRLIDDLLDVSRINRNKMELRRARIHLADAVNSAIETAQPVIDAAGHELVCHLPAQPVFLDADLTRLSQVFSNLLTNSARYTERGGKIWFTAETRGGEVVVSVRDTGIGIPAEALPTIFDMFSQVDRSIERSTGGLGIGLALVKGLVEMHGGTVTAQSDGQGRGSEFTVILPVVGAQPALEELADKGSQTGSSVKRRVLVVDDNRDGAESLAMMLEILGNEVAMAHDGIEAVEMTERFRPEIVLMDVGMPKLDGLEATRRIRKQSWGRNVTVIALTGWGQDADRERTRQAGCNGHLVKPVKLPDLEKVLATLRVSRTN